MKITQMNSLRNHVIIDATAVGSHSSPNNSAVATADLDADCGTLSV